jgi:hypothetical protein
VDFVAASSTAEPEMFRTPPFVPMKLLEVAFNSISPPLMLNTLPDPLTRK